MLHDHLCRADSTTCVISLFSPSFFACLTDFALAQKMFASYEGELAEAKKALKGYIQSIPSAKGGESPKCQHPFLFCRVFVFKST